MPRSARSRSKASLDALTILRRIGLSQRQCAQVATRAQALAVGADEVALAWSLVSADEFYRALADSLGVPFLAHPVAIDRRLYAPHVAAAGMLRDEAGRVVMAPQGEALRRFLADPPLGCAITTPELLRQSVRATYRTDAAWLAAAALGILSPHASAQRDGGASGFVIAAWLIALVAIAFGEPHFSLPVTLPLAFLFAWTIGQRIMAIALKRQGVSAPPPPLVSSHELPFYSILIPLYREDRVIPRLVGAMEALDYPPEKLEILFLVEDDDAMTRAALARMRLQPFMRIVPCPQGAPRTKPRALNIGLHECRGQYIAIFDAEDSPEPDQLLKAAAAFQQAPDDVACLQAELAIENGASMWLTRCFALEYAALFQIVVPGLCALNLPVALGGTSNHFRRDIVMALGGWDAWNVTEDADLGLRLAMNNYRVQALASRTWEEAPASWRDWRLQRIRWIKGWMQTALVHVREMHQARTPLGFHARMALWHHLIGTPVASLMTPLFTVALIAMAIDPGHDPVVAGTLALGTALAIAAAVTMAALFLHARPALSLRAKIQAMCTSPFYIVAISLCAWLALVELVRHPFRWNKTPHGESLPLPAPENRPRRKLWPGLASHTQKRRKGAQASPDAQAPPRL